MRGIRHLSIEIGPRCNLSHLHTKCPAHDRVIDREPLSIERIVETVEAAYGLGFEGFVGFHFYNEPTLYADRMREVMDALPDARFMLWTNNPDFTDSRIAWYSRSDYSHPDYPFDRRLENYEGVEPFEFPCYRPYIECAIDYSGRIALCCQDWQLSASPADVSTQDPKVALRAWYDLIERVSRMDTPQVCLTCKGRMNLSQYESALREVGM